MYWQQLQPNLCQAAAVAIFTKYHPHILPCAGPVCCLLMNDNLPRRGKIPGAVQPATTKIPPPFPPIP